MGLLIDGVWHDKWYDTKKSKGKFVRESAAFRNWITADGEPGPSGRGGFKAESGRYHLYVSYACPWAHRTLIFRELKGLTEHISVSVVHPHMLSNGWEFRTDDDSYQDHLFGSAFMHQIYTRAKSDYSGRVTVPVLWDKQTNTLVSNESSEIIRMLNSAFDGVVAPSHDFYPESLRPQIDAINEKVYANINNGVYRCGFATRQDAYEEAFTDLFRALDEVEEILGKNRYLTGSVLTEADWRLFTTLVRFDPVYVGHFKCNLRRIADYPNLSNYLRELYQFQGVAATVFMWDIKEHYYYSHDTINPTRVVPLGPVLHYDQPHDRDRFNL
ncbi:glutathione S-transferase family protein [Acanthopleuribacter pedis]|uniref:Glutathione S-transferase family protein n=1 Tax=Acanthopleuribacter pedis TaxID=442870 RepID=A0A8J7Q329_9BACT|nr:glutathione S-transferase family protein [Acanthopleuribacter pedis]MBO1319627.1 glutathione S-transferase family protein [Acanthopleuribacter pedis]